MFASRRPHAAICPSLFLILGTGIGLLAPKYAQGQDQSLSNIRRLILTNPTDSLLLDSLPIVPGTVVLDRPDGRPLPDTLLWTVNENTLVWTSFPPEFPVQVTYRILWLPPKVTIRQRQRTAPTTNPDRSVVLRPLRPSAPQTGLLDFRAMDYSGSFARGLSFGNRQNLVLNSNFNLQLAGDLGDDFQILAAISDENIPLQPEGNTQQLRDFDRIFVQLSRRNNQLIAGDYELAPGPGYFMRFFKKLQGATFSNKRDLGQGTWTNRVSVAVARGQFARQQLPLSEGNQGPYRLQGNQGERFLIVLAGTERVFLDGRLLTRGIENDYVMNYNQGEITFTAQTLITRESRVIVEFEYADQNYLRGLTHVDSRYEGQKASAFVQFFSQQDSRNSTLTLQLSEEDRAILEQAGDDPNKAVSSGIQPIDDPAPTRTTYRIIDTLSACGQRDSILVFSRTDEDQLFTARFTEVGPGNGHYILAEAGRANEPVYQWVAPDPLTCQPQGNFAPVIRLPAPQGQQLWTAGATVQLSPQATLQTELAFSGQDLNRFSRIDQGDNNGTAVYTRYTQRFPLAQQTGWQVTSDLQYEYKQETFRFLNPYRPQEFFRDWALTDFRGQGRVDPATEHLIKARLGLTHKTDQELFYGFNHFRRANEYSGTRHEVIGDLTFGDSHLTSNSSFLHAATPTDRRRFIRPDVSLARKIQEIGDWTVRINWLAEDNQRQFINRDSLLPSSYQFSEWRATLLRPDTSRLPLTLQYLYRRDALPEDGQLVRSLEVRQWLLDARYRLGTALQLKTRLNYRDLRVDRPELTDQNGGRTFLGRLQAGLTMLKGVVRSSTLYELGTGQEPRIDFTFVQVATGEGQYIWLDSLYNNDGIIQPNEMEIAPFPDQANYVRVSQVTNDFIGTRNLLFNQSLSLIPRVLWFAEKNNWKSLLARFSTQSSVRINRKLRGREQPLNLNPFDLNVADSTLVALSSGMQHTLFFNRGKPVFEGQLGMTDNRNRLAQTTGFESRRRTEFFVRTRLNLEKVWSLQLEATTGERFSESQNFPEKNFSLDFWTLEPQISWTPSRSFRWQLSLSQSARKDILRENGDQTRNQEIATELTFNQSVKTTLSGRFSHIQIDYQGDPNSPVGFALLNGLQPGRNLLWTLQLDQQLGRNLRLSLSYEGRQTGTTNVVHVGRAQVAAVF